MLKRRRSHLVGPTLLLGIAALAGPARAQYRGDISTIVLDAGTGNVLQQDQADLVRYPASLTKLMTLYLTFEALRDRRVTIDRAVPVSDHASSMEPSKLGLLPGSYITVDQAVLALVTKSANDAASALGELLGGDEDRFAQMMTLRARSLGMSHTTFRNASGLPDPDQVTTAGDLAILARHLITDFPDQYRYFAVPSFWFHGRLIPNHDPMLRIYPGADGLKTGFTDAAGCNLVTSAVRGNVRLIGVVLGAQNNVVRAQVMTALLNQGFTQEGVPVTGPSATPALRRPSRPVLLASDTVPAPHLVQRGRRVRFVMQIGAHPIRAGLHHLSVAARAPHRAASAHVTQVKSGAPAHRRAHRLMTALLHPGGGRGVADA